MKNDTQNVFPPALERSLNIIEYMLQVSAPLSIKEISEKLSIPHSSVFRIVKCLAAYGYLRIPSGQTDKYCLGYKFLQFAKTNSSDFSLNEIALPYMNGLVQKTGHACQLSILKDYTQIIIIEQVIPDNGIVMIASLNEALPVNVCASGKLLFALLPDDLRTSHFPQALSQFKYRTRHTIMDAECFSKQMQEIRVQNYSADNEEYADGIGCFSVPVYNFNNEIAAALTLTGPISHYKIPEMASSMLDGLFKAAMDLSTDLGFAGTYPSKTDILQ